MSRAQPPPPTTGVARCAPPTDRAGASATPAGRTASRRRHRRPAADRRARRAPQRPPQRAARARRAGRAARRPPRRHVAARRDPSPTRGTRTIRRPHGRLADRFGAGQPRQRLIVLARRDAARARRRCCSRSGSCRRSRATRCAARRRSSGPATATLPAAARHDLRPQRRRAGAVGAGEHRQRQPEAGRRPRGHGADRSPTCSASTTTGATSWPRRWSPGRPRFIYVARQVDDDVGRADRARSSSPGVNVVPRGPPDPARRRHRPQRDRPDRHRRRRHRRPRAAVRRPARRAPPGELDAARSRPAAARSPAASSVVPAGPRRRPRPDARPLGPVRRRAGAARPGRRARRRAAAPAIVMDTDTGEIFAMASVRINDDRASYEITSGNSRAVDAYEPGSVGKVITSPPASTRARSRRHDVRRAVAQAVHERDDLLHDSHEPRADEVMTVEQILVESSNIGTITVSETMRASPEAVTSTCGRSGSASRRRSTSRASRRASSSTGRSGRAPRSHGRLRPGRGEHADPARRGGQRDRQRRHLRRAEARPGDGRRRRRR